MSEHNADYDAPLFTDEDRAQWVTDAQHINASAGLHDADLSAMAWRFLAMENRVKAVENLHFRRPHTAKGGRRRTGFSDFVTHGQTEFPDLCDHCETTWPCITRLTLGTYVTSPGDGSES